MMTGAGYWRRASWWLKGLLVLAIAMMLLVVALAAFPWGLLRGTIEQRLTDGIGRPAKIASMARLDRFSFHPVVAVRGISVPQPRWAGEGDLAKVREAHVRFAALPLLLGRFQLEGIDVRGATVTLIRNAQGRESWNDGKKDDDRGNRSSLSRLSVSQSRLIYRDAKRDRSFDVAIQADVQRGLTLAGTGLIHRNPVTIKASGGAIAGRAANQSWPFRVIIDGEAVGATFAGTMDRPLDIGHLTANATAHGNDLALVDAIIEAGLPGTQPVRLAGKIRREAPDWIVTDLRGIIGHSDIAGDATIRKRNGRTRIEGSVHARQFDFGDLANDAGKARGRAKRALTGDRVLPETAIDLMSVARTDGKLNLRVDRLLWPGSSPFRSLRGTLSLERGRLVLDPLSLGLTQGRFSGRMIVDQQAGDGMAPVPRLDIQMNLTDTRLIAFFADAAIDGKLNGKVRLSGRGKTVRSAVSHADGVIALVARDGSIPARTASLLGEDIWHGVTGDKTEQAQLRCIIARLEVRNGIVRADPVLIDTTRALTRATGTIALSNETMNLSLIGAPKRRSPLRLSEPIPVRGTIKAPIIVVPQQAKSARGIFRMVGRAIAGNQGPIAQNADCTGLAAQALR